METVKVGLRLSQENVEWLDEQVQKIGERKTNRTAEIEKCIVQRRISLLPKWQQDKIARQVAGETNGCGDVSAGGGGGGRGLGAAGDDGGGEVERVDHGPEDDLFATGSGLPEHGEGEEVVAGDGDGVERREMGDGGGV